MFRIRTYLTNACLSCFDLTVTVLCHFTVWQLAVNGTLWPVPAWNLLIPDRLLAIGLVLVLWIILSAYFHLYHSRRLDSPFADAVSLLQVGLASWVALEGFARLLPQLTPAPLFLLRFEAINTLTLVAARLALRLLVRELRRQGRNVKNLVLVAAPELGDRVAEKIEQRAHLGYRIVRRMPDSG